MNGALQPPARRWRSAAFALVLSGFAIQNLGSMRVTSATSDETSHLPAGYTYLRLGDYRLNPQHPPLAKCVAAIPLLALAPRLDLEDPGWTASPPDEWGFGFRFLYANDADRLLFWGRLPIVLLGVLACVYVRLWARELFGENAGLLAVTLFALCPTVVAHSHLVTMDVPLAAFSVAMLVHLRRYCARPNRVDLAATGIFLGLSLATKFSALVFIPAVLAIVAAAGLAHGRGASEWTWKGMRGPLGKLGAAIAVLILLAVVVVWAVYRFPRDPLVYWSGLRQVNQDHDPTVPDYLMGAFRPGGWWYYFPVALLMKTPIPTLLCILAGLGTCRRFRSPSWLDELILFLPAALFLVATCAFAANIGVRYVIPIYAPLIVSASRVAMPLFRSVAGRTAGAAGLLWLVLGAATIHPDYLAYFNEAAGGPERGIDRLDDSNLDWGGSLPRLKRWMDENGVARIRLLYPWNGSPDYYGIAHEPVTAHDWLVAPRPGIYAVSTMALVRGRLEARESGARSDWLDRYEPSDRVGFGFYVYRFDDGVSTETAP